MELTINPRSAGKKSELKKMRMAGNIPVILYSLGEKGKEMVIDGKEFKKNLNKTEPGTLSSTIFSLQLNGKAIRAILKDIQYDIISYDVIHLDFIELHDKRKVTLNIPIKCSNVANCEGVKAGGVFRQAVRELRVSCLPKDIPTHFEIDVQNLGLGQAYKLSDLPIPKNVQPIGDLNQVAVVVSRK